MIHMTEDFALMLALDHHTRPAQALALIGAERADDSGRAEFDPGELVALLPASPPPGKKPTDWLRDQIKRGMSLGYLGEDSRNGRLVLPPGIRVTHR